MSLTDIDTQFIHQYEGLVAAQRTVFKQLSGHPFDLNKREMTDAILRRMDANWYVSEETNKLLGRSKKPSSAEYFNETCLFFIKAYLEGLKKGFQVRAEQNIKVERSRQIVKPDISILKNDRLVGVVEMKTLNDWMRNTWESHLVQREAQVKAVSREPGLFFAVIAHWNFFDENAPSFNTKYFGLRRRVVNTPTEATVEKLLSEFLTAKG